MTALDRQQLKSDEAQAQELAESGLKGDFAQGIRTEPVKNEGTDFARGERTVPRVDEGGPDYARGERTMPFTPDGPDYARGLRGKQGVG